MAYRFTNTDKWTDKWFSQLKQLEMLLFMYLCDNCDIAGFIEVNYKRWASDLNSSNETIEGATKGLQRGLVFSPDGECIFIRNFLKHQRNLPINPINNSHKLILKRFELYLPKFNKSNIDELLQGGSEGVPTPIGKGKGISNGNGNGKEAVSDFEKALNEFWIYRASIRKPVTERAKELILMELEKLAPNNEALKIEILNQSIRKGWQDVFPIKSNISKDVSPLTQPLPKEEDYETTSF